MKRNFNFWIKCQLLVFVLATLSCSKKNLGYLPNEDVKSKYGFKIYMNDGFQGDTLSLFVNGIELFRDEIFKAGTDLSNPGSSAEITVNEGALVGVADGRKFESTFTEQRHIILEVRKGKLKTTFNVDLEKGRFLYVEDFLFYGNQTPKNHLIDSGPKKRAPRNETIDYSVRREMVRLIQRPNPVALM